MVKFNSFSCHSYSIIESSATLFRGNSFATKVLKYHAEKYGQQYLKQVICTPLQVLLQRNPVLEVQGVDAHVHCLCHSQ